MKKIEVEHFVTLLLLSRTFLKLNFSFGRLVRLRRRPRPVQREPDEVGWWCPDTSPPFLGFVWFFSTGVVMYPYRYSLGAQMRVIFGKLLFQVHFYLKNGQVPTYTFTLRSLNQF